MQNESFDSREAEKQLNELFRQYLGEDQPGKAEQKKRLYKDCLKDVTDRGYTVLQNVHRGILVTKRAVIYCSESNEKLRYLRQNDAL